MYTLDDDGREYGLLRRLSLSGLKSIRLTSSCFWSEYTLRVRDNLYTNATITGPQQPLRTPTRHTIYRSRESAIS